MIFFVVGRDVDDETCWPVSLPGCVVLFTTGGTLHQGFPSPIVYLWQQAVTVLLVTMALMWTPLSQEWYDRCLTGETQAESAVCQRQITLRRTEAVVLAVFFAEMMVKVCTTNPAKRDNRHTQAC